MKLWHLIMMIWNWWFKLNQKIRFLLVGGFNTVVSYVLFLGLIWLLTTGHYQLALLLSWLLTSFTSFLTQKFFVWQTRGNFWLEYSKCVFTWVFAYALNAGLLKIFFENLHWPVWLGQAVAISIITIFTFTLFKYFAFARKKS